MVTMPGTSVMTEATTPGTVLGSTTGQALATAPLVTGTRLAQVSDVSQAKGPGTPAITDETGKVISAAVDTRQLLLMLLCKLLPQLYKPN